MTNVVLLTIVVISILATVSLVFVMIKTRRSAETQSDINQLLMNLSVGVTKSSVDMRQEISEKLNEKFSFIGKELREELTKSTQSLEVKFNTLETKVNERLD